MAIFNSYVKLPEGIYLQNWVILDKGKCWYCKYASTMEPAWDFMALWDEMTPATSW
jgi:hypothetical protein